MELGADVSVDDQRADEHAEQDHPEDQPAERPPLPRPGHGRLTTPMVLVLGDAPGVLGVVLAVGVSLGPGDRGPVRDGLADADG
ncbi:hypothetical protein GCM10010399_95380 [Dactylosporangium fulvum]